MLFYFYLCFTAHHDYFTHFEQSQSLGGAKMGDPREKTELGLPHVTQVRLKPIAVR